jgi:hypothetical protein
MNPEGTISLTFVRDRIKSFYDIMDTKLDAYIDLKILDSVSNMYSYKYITQECFSLDVCDCKVELPCYVKNVIAIIPDCSKENVQIIYSDFIFNGVQGNFRYSGFPNRWKIMNNMIVFPSTFEYEKIDIYCDVYKVGDDGFPLLVEAHVPYYERYALYWVGLKMSDARYREFKDYSGYRRNIVHNEQADKWEYEKHSVAAISRRLEGVDYRYFGQYASQINMY